MTKTRHEHPVLAYSTQTRLPGATQASTFDVVLNGPQLREAVKHIRHQVGWTWLAADRSLQSETVDPAVFGSFENAAEAYEKVKLFLDGHLTAVHAMGLSVEDFVARVEAAAQLATDADPATRSAAAWAAAHRQ